MNDFIHKFLFNRTELIGFKELETKTFDNNIIYMIPELILGVISKSLILKICSDFDRYIIFVK